jgi:predicted AlkP superfamily phosphohydrolase/phosphomutase
VRTAPITGAASPTIGVLRGEYRGVRTGDHRPTGYLIVSGPRFGAERRTAPVRSIDVSPTIAALLGVDMTDVEGSAVAELVDAHR